MAFLPSWEMSQLRALEVGEGVLIHYFIDTIVSSLDKIILDLFSGSLLRDFMANTDPN